MNFFIPAPDDRKDHENIYQTIKDAMAIHCSYKILDKKIYKLRFKHDGLLSIATVGEVLGSGSYINEGLVIAIFQTDNGMCLIGTPNHGLGNLPPIYVGAQEIEEIEFFPD